MRVCLLLLISTLVSAAETQISFNEDVRPILSKNCLACHGPDEDDRKAGFHLDTFEGITKKNKKGRVGIIPGDDSKGMVIERITSTDPDEVMPPSDHGKPLEPEEIEIIRKWVAQGAKYEIHWALQKPRSPKIPKSNHPSPKNDIDHFVAQRLDALDLRPTPQADPRVLLRRLALDLTGLPPSLEEVEVFAADPSEENYQAAIARYLASPAYGEHMATMWMDIARYADTVGYSGDEKRDIWPWRDWVIDAFNNNMPYDQFTTEQLAGDLIPNATENQILATAFHRNTLVNNEGGTSDEEFRTIAVKDRISTTMNGWMGLTLRCAECHTHKYDPITMKEYYEFYAFFNQTEDNDQKDDRPRIDVMPRGRDAELAAIKAKIAAAKAERIKNPSPWKSITPTEIISQGGASHTLQDDQTILFHGKNPEYDTYQISGKSAEETKGLRLDLFPARIHNDNFGRGLRARWFSTTSSLPPPSRMARKKSTRFPTRTPIIPKFTIPLKTSSAISLTKTDGPLTTRQRASKDVATPSSPLPIPSLQTPNLR